jgi:hypothetical protein
MQQVNLPSVGTDWHVLKMAFDGNRIQVYYDGSLLIDVLDNGFDSQPPYLSGGISVDLWTSGVTYALSADDIVVRALGN